MLVAVGEDGKRYNALLFMKEGVPLPKQRYFCRFCNKEVIPKQGSKKIWHFAHKPHEACGYYSEPESEVHLMMKSAVYNQLKERYGAKINIKFEEKIGDHITDIVVEYEKLKFAVEVQHSPISEEEVVDRTETYIKHGYQVVWVFDKDTFFKTKDGKTKWVNKGTKEKPKWQVKLVSALMWFVDHGFPLVFYNKFTNRFTKYYFRRVYNKKTRALVDFSRMNYTVEKNIKLDIEKLYECAIDKNDFYFLRESVINSRRVSKFHCKCEKGILSGVSFDTMPDEFNIDELRNKEYYTFKYHEEIRVVILFECDEYCWGGYCESNLTGFTFCFVKGCSDFSCPKGCFRR